MHQYTIKTLLVAAAITSAACTILFLLSPQLSFLTVMCVAVGLGSVLIGFIVYDRGYACAFGIGSLPALVFWIWFVMALDSVMIAHSFQTNTLIAMPMIAICGCSTMLIRQMSIVAKSDIESGNRTKYSLIDELLAGLILGLILAGLIGLLLSNTAVQIPNETNHQHSDDDF